MIRLWIQIVPQTKNGTDGYWGTNKMKETLSKLSLKEKSIKICPNRIKRSLIDYIKPKTVSEYMISEFGISKKEIIRLISQFDIKPNYKIKNLGTAHQKVFSILCKFQKRKIIVFDYYGLSPNTEKQLTKFVKSELKKGKSAIGFDNLYFIPNNPDSEMIKNLEILRIKEKNKN